MTSTAGYKSVFAMPVIARPPAASANSPSSYYSSLNASITVTPTLVDAGLRIEISPVGQSVLYAMFGGTVRYLPPQAPLPFSSQLAPAKGGLALQVALPDYSSSLSAFPPGTPSVTTVLYLGVEQATVAAALLPDVTRIGPKALQRYWAATHIGAPPAGTDFAADYLAKVMVGAQGVFVDGGTPLGKAGVTGLTGAAFELRMVGAGIPATYMSPLGVLLGAPFYVV